MSVARAIAAVTIAGGGMILCAILAYSVSPLYGLGLPSAPLIALAICWREPDESIVDKPDGLD